jgi:galactoside O-acetyltransferase
MVAFARLLATVSPGSEKWHVLQQSISLGPPVGTEQMKRNLFYTRTLASCGTEVYVLPHVSMSYPQNIELGRNVFINRGVNITARERISIGDNALIGPYVVLNSGSHEFSDPHQLIRDQGHRRAPIRVEQDVWIGAHATILPGVIVGQGGVVAAGAVVTRSVEPYTVVAGVPARLMKRRG